jgi:hypothetical protein
MNKSILSNVFRVSCQRNVFTIEHVFVLEYGDIPEIAHIHQEYLLAERYTVCYYQFIIWHNAH